MIATSLRLGDIRERAARFHKAPDDPGPLPASYKPERPLGEVWKTNLKFVRSLDTVWRSLEAEGTTPGSASVGDVLARTPRWLSHQKRRGLAWGAGAVCVTGAGVGAMAASTLLMAEGMLASVVGVGGMIGGLVGFATCLTMTLEAVSDHRALRRAAEHLESWARLDQDRQRQEVEALVQPERNQPPGHISDEPTTVIVGGVRLPKQG